MDGQTSSFSLGLVLRLYSFYSSCYENSLFSVAVKKIAALCRASFIVSVFMRIFRSSVDFADGSVFMRILYKILGFFAFIAVSAVRGISGLNKSGVNLRAYRLINRSGSSPAAAAKSLLAVLGGFCVGFGALSFALRFMRIRYSAAAALLGLILFLFSLLEESFINETIKGCLVYKLAAQLFLMEI